MEAGESQERKEGTMRTYSPERHLIAEADKIEQQLLVISLARPLKRCEKLCGLHLEYLRSYCATGELPAARRALRHAVFALNYDNAVKHELAR
jgi:hypothetical protein